METGPRFLTPNNPNITTRLHSSSILLLENGFCFCTPGHKTFYPFSDFGNKPSASLEAFIKQQHNLSSLTLLLLDYPSLWIPSMLFQHKNLNKYWESFAKIPAQCELRVDTSSNGLLKVVYPYPNKIITILKTSTDSLSVVPAYNPLYDRILEQSKNDFTKQIYIHLMRGQFDVFITQGTRIILANRYPHQNEEDFMYYLFYVSEQLQLTAHNSKLFFLGQFDQYQTYYEGVRNFQSELQFLDTDRKSPMGIQDPTPYWYA